MSGTVALGRGVVLQDGGYWGVLRRTSLSCQNWQAVADKANKESCWEQHLEFSG